MAADAWKKFNMAPFYIGNGTINLATHTFKVLLMGLGWTPNAETQSVYANISANELATGNGYTAGGLTVAATWTRSTGTCTFDVADAVWTASGGSLSAMRAVLMDDTPTSPAKPLIGWTLLDNTAGGTLVTVTSGNILTVQVNVAGVFDITGMA